MTNSKWVCSGKINRGAESCPSFPIYEDEIKPVLFEAFRDTEADVEAIIGQYTDMFRKMVTADDLQGQIDSIKTKLELIQKKKAKLLEYNVSGKMSDAEYLEMSRMCEQEGKEARAILHELEDQQMSHEEFRERMQEIEKTLRLAQADAANGLISAEFVSKYIDKIFVTPVDANTALLEIRIFTGDVTQKYLRKLANRTGVISKKMIESYENSLKK